MKYNLFVVSVVLLASCAAFDQYVTRRAAEYERTEAESRAAVEHAAVEEYGAGTTVRYVTACQWEVCIGGGRLCIPKVRDMDLDGSADAACGGEDCRDDDPLVSPNRTETCDGVDNDCDGMVDETCTPGEPLHT